jgi:hypothetical protein
MIASLLCDLTSLLGSAKVLHQKGDFVLFEYDGSMELAGQMSWHFPI